MRTRIGGRGVVLAALGLAWGMISSVTADSPWPATVLARGLKTPESVCVGPGGRIFVSEINGFGVDGDGQVSEIKDGKPVPFATGLDDPKGIIAVGNDLFVTDKTKVVRIDGQGKTHVYVAPGAFPATPKFLNDIEADAAGNLYVSDTGDLEKGGGAVYRITKDRTVTTVITAKPDNGLSGCNGLLMDGESFLLVLDFGTGNLVSVNLLTGKSEIVSRDHGGGDGLARDWAGRLYLTDWKAGRLSVISRPWIKPGVNPIKFEASADICISGDRQHVLVPDFKAGTLTAVKLGDPANPVDESPLPLETELTLEKIVWTGWADSQDSGTVEAFRPIVLTHAGDGSKRTFVATEHGVIHVLAAGQTEGPSKVFADLRDRVVYNDRQNEEGFLGLAFHPKYRTDGRVFVYYTRKPGNLSIVSSFRVSKDDPNKLDAGSETVLMQIPQPFWNHNGGTICFGPDGYLYIALGDGGAFNDPHDNAQNPMTWLGSILRIDVDSTVGGANYGIPKDNPFAGKSGGHPEVFAWGVRNPWRMAFDRKTGEGWFADVGQNLYEEICRLEKGGNYGWARRESFHPFGRFGMSPNEKMIEPIWEYHHDIGKSVTGGHVFRGGRLPELDGMYLYADYVSGKLWALKYDPAAKRVTANREIASKGLPILSYGEDEDGEVYLLTFSLKGQGIHRFVRKK